MDCVDSIVDVLRAANGHGATTYAAGVRRQCNGRPRQLCSVADNFNTSGVAHTAALAKQADAAILVLGIDTDMEGEGNDRLNTSLSFAQKELGREVLATGTPTVLIIVGGGAVSVDTLVGHGTAPTTAARPKAVVQAGYLCDNQKALADLLFGKRNRWGKLSATIYAEDYALKELPAPTQRECGCDGTPATYKTCTACSVGFLNMSMRPDLSVPSTNPGRSYKWYRGSNVLYPFSHGLSYTTFQLKWADDDDGAMPSRVLSELSEEASHDVLVTNTGHRTGDEVVFAFFTPPSTVPRATAPIRQLYAFERVADLAPGETRRVSFPVSARALSLVDEQGTRRVYSGDFQLELTNGAVGASEARLTGGVARVQPSAAQVVRSLPSGTGAV